MIDCYVYHICREGDVGDLTKGYLGISKEPEKRWHAHRRGETNAHLTRAYKKYNDIVEYIVLGWDHASCLLMEHLWRPHKKIGWNLAVGGGLPPSSKGIKRSAEFCKRTSERQRGELNHAYGKPAHNNGVLSIDYSTTPCRRDYFKKLCIKKDFNFEDFKEEFAEWRVKPSGIRYRVYTYHKEPLNGQ